MKCRWPIRLALMLIPMVLAGCSSLPPLIQDRDGKYGLYLPTPQQLIDAAVFQSRFTLRAPKTRYVVEQNSMNGHTRLFNADNGSYLRYPEITDTSLYQGPFLLRNGDMLYLVDMTYRGFTGYEASIIFQPNGVIATGIVGTPGVHYRVESVENNEVLLRC